MVTYLKYKFNYVWWDWQGLLISLFVYGIFAVCAVVAHDFVVLPWHRADRRSLALTNTGNFLFGWYMFLTAMAVVCHFMCMTSDPGYINKHAEVPMKSPDEETKFKKCRHCLGWKPPRAHHCKICQRCVFWMDHHCPWVNTCVGYGNQKYFMLFLFYTGLLSTYTIALVGHAWHLWYQANLPRNLIATGAGSFLGITAIFFSIFVAGFLQEQIEAIRSNTTLVETYQYTRGAKPGNFLSRIKNIFGQKYWMWFLPIPTTTVPDYLEKTIKDEGAKPWKEELEMETRKLRDAIISEYSEKKESKNKKKNK